MSISNGSKFRIVLYAAFLLAAIYVYRSMRQSLQGMGSAAERAAEADPTAQPVQSSNTQQSSAAIAQSPSSPTQTPPPEEGVMYKGTREYETLYSGEYWDEERQLQMKSVVKRTDFMWPLVMTQKQYRKGITGEWVEAGERRMVADHFIVTLESADLKNSFVNEITRRGWRVRKELFDGKMVVVTFDTNGGIEEWRSVFAELGSLPGVKAVVPDDLTSQP